MKAILLVLTLVSTVAQATDGRIVARIRTAGGMPGPEGACMQFDINVYDNGKVISDNCGEKNEIARVGKDTIANMIKKAESMESSELVEVDPNAPQCLDAPNTDYSLFTKSGREVVIGGVYSCRDSVPAKDTADMKQIRNFLKNIR